RVEPLFGRASAAPRADTEGRWLARGHSEQGRTADRCPFGAGARERPSGAERSIAVHQRQGSDGAAALQFPRSERTPRGEQRRALPWEGRAGEHHRKLVPELPRRGALPGRVVPAVPEPRARNRRVVVRRGGAAEKPDAFESVHQTVWRRIPGAPVWRAERSAREARASREPELVSDDVLRRAGWAGARRDGRVPRQSERQVPRGGDGRNHRTHRADAC